MKLLQTTQFIGADLSRSCHNDVDVTAVRIEITQRKRSHQVHSDELVAKKLMKLGAEVVKHAIDVCMQCGIWRMAHRLSRLLRIVTTQRFSS